MLLRHEELKSLETAEPALGEGYTEPFEND